MSRSGRILIVEDDADFRAEMFDLLVDAGYEVAKASDGYRALAQCAEFRPDVVLTDLMLPGINGVDLMEQLRKVDDECAVILVTGSRSIETAVDAMRKGATHYLTKPFRPEELLLVLDGAMTHRQVRKDAGRMRRELSDKRQISSIIGTSPPMQHLTKMILQAAPSNACVMITGESGTGKERVAAAVHEHSSRASGPFVQLHCGALAESLVESELFGHERGAFTGAHERRVGRFEEADGGTLFLDEIGDISLVVQVKLLRFLQEREFQRVGGNKTLKTDVRVVAATHRDLAEAVRAGTFREDLFYRLNVVSIHVPALRERTGDVLLLAEYFLKLYAEKNGTGRKRFTDEALGRLQTYNWPGNVRELENTIERAVVLSAGDQIGVDDLPEALFAPGARGEPNIPGSTLEEIERYALLKTLEMVGGNRSRAARTLGISERTVQNKLAQYRDQSEITESRSVRRPTGPKDEGAGAPVPTTRPGRSRKG